MEKSHVIFIFGPQPSKLFPFSVLFLIFFSFSLLYSKKIITFVF